MEQQKREEPEEEEVEAILIWYAQFYSLLRRVFNISGIS